VEKSADVSEGHTASIFCVEVMTVNGMIYIGNGGQGKMMFKTGMILRTHV
jgi:hypothetical protein